MHARRTAMVLLGFLVLGAPSRGEPPSKGDGPERIAKFRRILQDARKSLDAGPATLPENPDPYMMKRVLEQARLQGEWLPKYLLTTSGIEPYPLKGRALEFTDDAFTQWEGRRRVQVGTFTPDPSSRGLDLTVEQYDPWDLAATPQKPTVPQTLKCGYRVYGDLLTVCYTVGKDRPSDLTPGAGRTVVVYERVK